MLVVLVGCCCSVVLMVVQDAVRLMLVLDERGCACCTTVSFLSNTHTHSHPTINYINSCIQVLLFEGSITLLVPLQEAVVDERQRQAFPKVYERVILSIIVFYAFFGITCWMAFGNEVRTVLTTSLPDTILSTTVQLAYSVAVIFTFPLQNFPALEIACKSIGNLCSSSGTTTRASSSSSCWKTNKRNIIASFLVIALALVAIATMDSLDKVVSLMGSLLGCPIAFIFPPLIHSSLIQDLSPGRKWANRIVVVLGFVSMVLASITTLIAW